MVEILQGLSQPCDVLASVDVF